MPTADRGLTVTGLSAQAGAFTLGPVDLAVPPDRVLVVLGPSGAGKTMLLETIAGLRPAQAGRISLAGTDITGLPPERRRIGIVFQDAALFPHLTVEGNVRFGPRAGRAPSPDGADEADGLMRRLGIAHLADRSPRSLSGGERQRVALARALAIRPGLLLLDEPLSALDQPTREDLRGLLRQLLTRLEIPAAHITHDRDEALSIGDDLAVVVDGRLRQAGPAATVAAEPADASVARLLGWSELGPGTATGGTARVGRLTIHGDVPPSLNGDVQAFYRPEDVQLGPVADDEPTGTDVIAHVERVSRTRPLARVVLRCDPPVTALMLHRDLDRLRLTTGDRVRVGVPQDSLRVFPPSENGMPGGAPDATIDP